MNPLIDAVDFVLRTLLACALYVALLRLLMQWSRADFRNPISQAVVQLTNPVIMPLRRILPPVGKIDTASVVTVVLIAVAKVAAAVYVVRSELPPLTLWARLAALEIVSSVLTTYYVAIIVYALLSFIAPGGYSPVQSLLTSLCEPILRPFRRLIPPIGNSLDLSPLWACIAIQVLLILLRYFE